MLLFMESQALPFAKTPSALGLAVCGRRDRPHCQSLIPVPPSSLSSSFSFIRIRAKNPAISPFSLKRRLIISSRASSGCQDLGHDHGHHHRTCGQQQQHQHQHHAHHHHHHHGDEGELNKAQQAILRFANAVGWADLADFLRENLQLCCCSMGLLLLAAASPYAPPARAVKPLQGLLIAVAFPLVGVRLSLLVSMISLECDVGI